MQGSLLLLVCCLNKSLQKGKLALTPRRHPSFHWSPRKARHHKNLKTGEPWVYNKLWLQNCNQGDCFTTESCFANLVDNDQMSFLKGCSNAKNICMINNVISYMYCIQNQRILQSCFSLLTLRKPSIQLNGYLLRIQAFHHVGFSIQNCGWSAGFFELSWGERQGCQLSPYICILFPEVLASTIRKVTMR